MMSFHSILAGLCLCTFLYSGCWEAWWAFKKKGMRERGSKEVRKERGGERDSLSCPETPTEGPPSFPELDPLSTAWLTCFWISPPCPWEAAAAMTPKTRTPPPISRLVLLGEPEEEACWRVEDTGDPPGFFVPAAPGPNEDEGAWGAGFSLAPLLVIWLWSLPITEFPASLPGASYKNLNAQASNLYLGLAIQGHHLGCGHMLQDQTSCIEMKKSRDRQKLPFFFMFINQTSQSFNNETTILLLHFPWLSCYSCWTHELFLYQHLCSMTISDSERIALIKLKGDQEVNCRGEFE